MTIQRKAGFNKAPKHVQAAVLKLNATQLQKNANGTITIAQNWKLNIKKINANQFEVTAVHPNMAGQWFVMANFQWKQNGLRAIFLYI